MSAFVIDAFEFCRLKERLEGDVAVADLARLAEDTVDRSGLVHWSLQGESDSNGHPQLMLSVSGSVRLLCQRCLTPFAFGIASETALILAKDENSVDEIDALLADDTIDVIVGSRAMDIIALIEDEALLALPLSPRHDVCPDQSMVSEHQEAKKDSPFAILKNIKK